MVLDEADPYRDDGPVSMCDNCYKGVIWLAGKGWVHQDTRKKKCRK